MPLYDYHCEKCNFTREYFHKMAEEPEFNCPDCLIPLVKSLTTGYYKRPDATWIRDVNGYVNDMDEVRAGRQEYVETREQARKRINEMYSDPHPRVQALRKRYLERY